MAFRKLAALSLALAAATVFIGCTDQLVAPTTTNDQPVLPPTNVVGYALSDGHVRVKWDASSEPTVNGYNLYRRVVGIGNPKKINGTRILATQYLDGTTTAPTNYEYRLTAVNAKGKESHWVSVVVHTQVIIGSGTNKLPATGTE